MNKILIIIAREYASRVRKKSFFLMTILMPLLFIAIVTVPIWLTKMNTPDDTRVAVVDKTQQYAPLLADTAHLYFTKIQPGSANSNQLMETYDIVLNIDSDLVQHPNALSLSSKKEIQEDTKALLVNQLNNVVKAEKIKQLNIPNLQTKIESLEQGVNVKTMKLAENGNTIESNAEIASIIGFVLTFLIYIFVLTYGSMVLQSVFEEKSNRIVEVMVSIVKPFELLAGKIIGIALVGLTQILVWIGLCTGIYFLMYTLGNSDAQMLGSLFSTISTTISSMHLPVVEILFMFVLMFIGGFLTYASFFAAVGASINEQRDSSQFILPVTLILMFALYAAMYSKGNTDSGLAFWASMCPLTAPVVMMVRVPLGVPLWQELLSVALVYLFAFAIIALSAKIYKVGILMYGKKPTFKDFWKWLHYK